MSSSPPATNSRRIENDGRALWSPRNQNARPKIGIGSGGARWLPTSCRCINRFRSRHGVGEGGGRVRKEDSLWRREGGWIGGTGWRTAGQSTGTPSRWTELVQSRATLRIFLRLAPPSPSLRRCGLHLRLRRTPRLPHLRLFRASADAFRIRVGGARNPETRDHEVSADSAVWTALDGSTWTV